MSYPNFDYEHILWSQGLQFVGGCDEVGRGCFAGPVVAGCVVFPPALKNRGLQSNIKINDSKRLTPKEREKADIWIKKNAISWAVGTASVTQINKFGIKKASDIAFRKAIKNTKININSILIDAFYIPFVPGLKKKNQFPIIKGDEKSFSIAAASIVAKVYRDNLMRTISNEYRFKKYGWYKNKGYGTREHREAILKYGTTHYHRTVFVSTYLSKFNNLPLINNS